MLKLKKVKPTEWLGNNMGEATAEWAVVGHENYQLRKLGSRWVACDTDQFYEDKYGRERVTQVCFGYTRTECLKMLAVIIKADTEVGPEDDGNLAWAENYGGPGLGGWQG